MNDIVKQKIEEIYDQFEVKLNSIIDIAKFHYGEDNVIVTTDYTKPNTDNLKTTVINTVLEKLYKLQPVVEDIEETLFKLPIIKYTYVTLLIYIPKATVTNENNNSIDIEDIYFKIAINLFGNIGDHDDPITLIRSKFTIPQYRNRYVHSHAGRLYTDSFYFSSCCFGTGPIKTTIAILKSDFTVLDWQLFFTELTTWLKTESILGGPYISLESLTKHSTSYLYQNSKCCTFCIKSSFYYKKELIPFIHYLCDKNILKFNYYDNHFNLANTWVFNNIQISNLLIQWLKETKNEELYRNMIKEKLLNPYILKQGRIYIWNNKYHVELENNKFLFYFGKKIVRLNIDNIDVEEHYNLILCPTFFARIIQYILNIINYFYERNTTMEVGQKLNFI